MVIFSYNSTLNSKQIINFIQINIENKSSTLMLHGTHGCTHLTISLFLNSNRCLQSEYCRIFILSFRKKRGLLVSRLIYLQNIQSPYGALLLKQINSFMHYPYQNGSTVQQSFHSTYFSVLPLSSVN